MNNDNINSIALEYPYKRNFDYTNIIVNDETI